ncbi:MAG TPA: hypothetical protein VF487_10440 [Chitinophagaceae bacterium]
MKFYIQKEEDLPINISVQTDNAQTFVLVPESPHAIESTHNIIIVHVPANFTRQVHGNNVRPIDGGIYLVSLEDNGDLSIGYIGSD